MNLRKVLFNVGMAAAVAAITAAGTSHLLLRYSPLGVPEQPHLERIVNDYLTKHPEILVVMSTELNKRQAAEQTRQAAEQAKNQQKAITENADAIFHSSVSYVAGNPNGDVSVVEFFDYNCGYCRHALPDVVKLINNDGEVRLVLKELPIFGDDSVAAAKLALASNKQGKYFEMHQKLLSEPGKADKEKALRIAKDLGLNIEQLKEDAEDPAVKQALDEAKQLSTKLGLRGTPIYLVRDRALPGVPDDLYAELKAMVAEVRESGGSEK